MRTVIIPMAGDGTRFKEKHPIKVLAPVGEDQEPMFVHAVKHLGFSFDRLILICKAEHKIKEVCDEWMPDRDVEVVSVRRRTEGPLCSIITANPLISDDPDGEIFIANADQVMNWPGDWAVDWWKGRGAVAGVPTLERHSRRHSYVLQDLNYPFRIVGAKEKDRVSTRATIGLYWFANAQQFQVAARDTIQKMDYCRTNKEYYVSHVLNHMEGLMLEFPLCEFWSIGEPANLDTYLARDYEANRAEAEQC